MVDEGSLGNKKVANAGGLAASHPENSSGSYQMDPHFEAFIAKVSVWDGTQTTQRRASASAVSPRSVISSLSSLSSASRRTSLSSNSSFGLVTSRRSSFNSIDELDDIRHSYIYEPHIEGITKACRRRHLTVSFRPAGAHTLECVAKGAPMKGHDILEKTVKEPTLRHDPARVEAFRQAGILGYVGHWASDGSLYGLYVHPRVKEFEHSDDADQRAFFQSLRKTEDGHLYYPIDEQHLDASLSSLKALPDWQAIPFTGDYDMHDLWEARSPVPSGSFDEKRIIQIINESIAELDPARDISDPYARPVQHGPQVSYPAYMFTNEKTHLLKTELAQPSLPVALCKAGHWSIINTKDDLEKLYSKDGITLKNTWRHNSSKEFCGRVNSRKNSVTSLHALVMSHSKSLGDAEG